MNQINSFIYFVIGAIFAYQYPKMFWLICIAIVILWILINVIKEIYFACQKDLPPMTEAQKDEYYKNWRPS